MPHAISGDLEIYYEIHGDSGAEPLVLIEGLGSDIEGFKQLQVPSFVSAGYRCILVENRGVGRSSMPDRKYTTEDMAMDALHVISDIGDSPVHLAGWSMGGAIAMHLTERCPELVKSLQLHCTWPRSDAYLVWQLERRREILTEMGYDELYRNVVLSTFTPEYFETSLTSVRDVVDAMVNSPNRQPPYSYLRQLDACINHDAYQGLPSICVPTLITVGAEDPLIAPRFSRQLKDAIPSAELRVIDGAAHGHSMEKTEIFNDICLSFLASVA